MKKTTIIAAFLMVVSTCTFAAKKENKEKDTAKGESTATVINSTKENVYKLHYSSSKPGRVTVHITDAKGKIILTDYIKHQESFIRPYNFQDLSDGSYFVEIDDHAGKIKIPVTHKNASTSHFSRTYVKALSGSKKYELRMNGEFKTGIEVVIYNNSNTVIYSDYITEKKNFSRVYDLSKVHASSLTFIVKSNDKLIHREKF